VGAEESPAVKNDKCLINHVLTEIEIECLATQLPEHITVDLSKVEKGATIHNGDIQLPKGIKLVTHGRTNITVATVVEPVEEVVAAPVAAPADDKKKKKK
jgi:large subunit ribosomal protein L25